MQTRMFRRTILGLAMLGWRWWFPPSPMPTAHHNATDHSRSRLRVGRNCNDLVGAGSLSHCQRASQRVLGFVQRGGSRRLSQPVVRRDPATQWVAIGFVAELPALHAGIAKLVVPELANFYSSKLKLPAISRRR